MRGLSAVVAVAAAAGLILPSGGFGKVGDGKETQPVTYNIEGVYRSSQKVRITGGNKHAIAEAKLNDKVKRFDMERAVIDTDDTNDDGYQDWRDLLSGDRVYIKSEMPKKRPGGEPYPVRAIFNRTHPRPS